MKGYGQRVPMRAGPIAPYPSTNYDTNARYYSEHFKVVTPASTSKSNSDLKAQVLNRYIRLNRMSKWYSIYGNNWTRMPPC